jgi:hypothetical protein
MLRASPRLRQAAYKGYEQTRRENDRRRAMLYDKDGRFNLRGAYEYYKSDVGTPVKCTLALIVILFVYQRVVVWATGKSTRDLEDAHKRRKSWLRESGKLKSEKYMCDQGRQTDDPDFDNVPCMTTREDSAPYRSRSWGEDKLTTGALQDERRRAS